MTVSQLVFLILCRKIEITSYCPTWPPIDLGSRLDITFTRFWNRENGLSGARRRMRFWIRYCGFRRNTILWGCGVRYLGSCLCEEIWNRTKRVNSAGRDGSIMLILSWTNSGQYSKICWWWDVCSKTVENGPRLYLTWITLKASIWWRTGSILW